MALRLPASVVFVLVLVLLFTAAASAAAASASNVAAPNSLAPAAVPIFVSDATGCFRIPALLQLPSGVLLAFAEHRGGTGCGDDGLGHNLVMKRSADGGASWGAMSIVVGNASNLGPGGVGYTNPVPTLVRLPSGAWRVLFVFATLNNPCASVHGATMLQWSDDEGAT